MRYGYLNGEYRVLSKRAGYLYLFQAPTCNRQNYVAELDARWEGATGSSYGIIFGITGGFDHYYLFDINTDYQEYRLYRRDPSGFTSLVPRTFSQTIHSGAASNHLQVIRNGSSIQLEVNGTVLTTYADSLISGLTGVGLVTSPYTDQPTADARFDNFRVVGLSGSGAAVQGPSRTTSNNRGLYVPNARVNPVPADKDWWLLQE